MKRPDGLRIMIAIGSLAIGALHLRLYFDSYRDVGRSRTSGAASSPTLSPRSSPP